MTDVYNNVTEQIQSDATHNTALKALTLQNLLSRFRDRISELDILNINSRNVDVLNLDYKLANRRLSDNNREQEIDMNTNKQKTYYETQGIAIITYYTHVFSIMYILMFIFYVIGCFEIKTQWFEIKSQWSITKKIMVGLGLIVLPFVTHYAVIPLARLYQLIHDTIPSSTYQK